LINVSLKSTLSDRSIATLLFWVAIDLVYIFPAFHPKPVFISVSKMGLLQTTDCQIVLFNPVCQSVSFDGRVELTDIQCEYWQVCGDSTSGSSNVVSPGDWLWGWPIHPSAEGLRQIHPLPTWQYFLSKLHHGFQQFSFLLTFCIHMISHLRVWVTKIRQGTTSFLAWSSL
jgi:hypothetical protein